MIGNALPLQSFAFCFGFGLFHDENLFGFASRVCGDLFALCGIDIVHGRLHLGIGNNIGHQHIDDFIAKAGHIGIQLLLHGGGNPRLAGKHLVESHARNMSEDDLLDIRLNLFLGVR